ncbi:hypothetical protein ACFQ0T_32150 [Kitasatospora gansuensis]
MSQHDLASAPVTVNSCPGSACWGTPAPVIRAARLSEKPAAVWFAYPSPSLARTLRSTNQVPASSLKTCCRSGSMVTVPRHTELGPSAVQLSGLTSSTP